MSKETKEKILEKEKFDEKQANIENAKNLEKQDDIQEEINKQSENPQKFKGKKVKKVLNIIKNSIMIILIILCIIILIRAAKYKTLDIFGYRFYTIMSGSMEPEMYVGDVVITKTVNNVNIGDVIAFKGKNEAITVHRIVDVVKDNENEKVYQTKGDNNNANDPFTVDSSTIQGRYMFKVPYLGDVILFLKKHLILVIAIASIIILMSIIRLFIS